MNKILRTHSRSTDRDEIPGGRQPLNAIAVPLDLQLIAGDLYCTLVSLYCNQLLISELQYKLIAQHDIAINFCPTRTDLAVKLLNVFILFLYITISVWLPKFA